MKKLFAFISCLLLLSCSLVFAEVTATKNADGTVSVTFFYGNPRATEVLLAGDFNNWQDGAEAMEKTEKGFTLTKVFKMGEEHTYKFISDGNWTTDLKAPMFIDDGFGGKNGKIIVADLVGGDGDAGTKSAKMVFGTWTTMGIQANYRTVGVNDAADKGLDLNSVTVGMKSYNKFDGQFLPGCPFHVELALAEIDMEDYERSNDYTTLDSAFNGNMNYLFRQDKYGDEMIGWDEGFKQFFGGLFGDPVSYFARAKDNEKGASKKELGENNTFLSMGDEDKDGPGMRPIIGHLKFAWDTPILTYTTGFNYAKPDQRDKITWMTVDGNWDAGYKHTGGFNVFSIGSWAQEALAEKMGGVKLDLGFAPNRSADRKGYHYGMWAWAGISLDDLVVDVQVNGMYGRDYLFYEPVEHDIIIGVKDKFSFGDAGKFGFAVDWLFATHQRSSAEIMRDWGQTGNTTDFFGYSTDVFYRSGDFDGVKNMAGNIKLSYEHPIINVTLGYRLRGAQASMLFIRENHDDGVFSISDQLGVLNSQAIELNAAIKPVEGLGINIGFIAEMPLEKLDYKDELVDKYLNSATEGIQSWYKGRFFDSMEPLFNRDGGAELTIKPGVSYNFADQGINLGVYVDMNANLYDFVEEIAYDENHRKYDMHKDDALYSCSDSKFRAKKGGLSFNWSAKDAGAFKGLDAYYGFDLSSAYRFFNTIAVQVKLLDDLNVYAMIGIKSENTLSDHDGLKGDPLYKDNGDFDSDMNNPFAFAIGISKQFKRAKKPVIYAQFVYNTDPFQHFGGAQEQFNLDRANVKGSWNKEGATSGRLAGGDIKAVDWYDGRAALRFGCRWSI